MAIMYTARQGARAAKPLLYIPPVTRGLVGFWLHGGDAERSGRNLWVPDGSGDAPVVGTPTYGEHYMDCTPLQHFHQTPYEDTPDATLITVGSSPATFAGSDKPIFFSNFVGSATAGASIYVGSGTGPDGNVLFGADFGQNVRSATIAATNLDQPHILMSVIENGVGITGIDATEGKQSHFAVTDARETGGGGPMRIGSSYSTGFLGLTRCCATVKHNVALTPEERQAWIDYLRGFYSRRNIPV